MTSLPPVLPNSDEHEAKCRRCGISCHNPILFKGKPVVFPELHCTFLGAGGDGTFYCTVYENRFEKAPWCHTANEALTLNALAWDCPYAADVPDYNGKRWATPTQRGALLPIIRETLLKSGLPVDSSPDSALGFLEGGKDAWTYRLEGEVYRFAPTSPAPPESQPPPAEP